MGVHVFFCQPRWICDELHWLSPCVFVTVQPWCFAFVNNIFPRHSAAPLKLSLRPEKHSSWDEIRLETVDPRNHHLKPLSPATKIFKWNGNDLTLITSWRVMTLISPIFFPVDRIMTSSFRDSTLCCYSAESGRLWPNIRQTCEKKSKESDPVTTGPTVRAKPVYFQAGTRKKVHPCEAEWVLNISITAPWQWEPERESRRCSRSWC